MSATTERWVRILVGLALIYDLVIVPYSLPAFFFLHAQFPRVIGTLSTDVRHMIRHFFLLCYTRIRITTKAPIGVGCPTL